MVNEKRLQHMIKMAVYDSREKKECRPMEQYARKDYVSLKLIGSFVSGTIGFLLIVAMWVFYSLEELMQGLNSMDIPAFLISLLTKYVVFVLVYLIVTYLVSNSRYTAGRKKVKKYYANIKKLNQIYQKEEK